MARPLKTVALGGGHGLQATLTALRSITPDVTAVVTVADDGGSSGRLRRELGLLPPGDLRKALLALADESAWSAVFGHRFGGAGALAGHAVGNLVLAGLLEVLNDPLEALDTAGRLLGVHGRVLPMCTEPMDIEADVIGLAEDPDAVRRIRGQVAVATTPGRVLRVRLRTVRPGPPRACQAAVEAVRDADVVLLGPGSWFTSVLPHLLVPELHDALVSTTAAKVIVLNLVPQPGETAGFSAERHLDVLREHAPKLRADAVIADVNAVPMPERFVAAAAQVGAKALLAAVAASDAPERHDPVALAGSLRQAIAALGAFPRKGGQRGDDR
ncbi:MAG TPA: uridine diphosphate-N-acetylglucosamine-binding protein YvcK [Pseudonocardiaceae bacterium]